MFAQITSRRFIHSVSRLRKLYRAGLVSIAVMLVLSFTVLTSAVSSGYLAMSDPSNNDSSSSTQAKSNPARYNTRLSMRFHTDEQNGTATVTTEKSDYQPGEYVTVTGAGWLPGEAVNLLFHQRLDEPSREDSTLTAIADAEGKIFNNEYFLEEPDRGVSYVVKATGTQSGYYAQVYFTDAASATLDQCANGSLATPDLTPCQGGDAGGEGWVNGNLGASKSHYSEGESISYRLMFSGLTAGTHVVTIEWDTTKGGKHAIDYLTTYNRTVNSNPCEGVGCNQGIFSPFAIPADPQVTGAGVTPVAGDFRLFGGSITGVGAYSYPDGTGFAGDKTARITLTFNATVENPVLAWGGHIAHRLDWGSLNSAVAISGSPFHTRLIDLDGAGGNQDRSLSADAVTFPASVTIIKDTVPNGPRDFDFSATGGLTPSSFTLDDDSDPPLSNTQSYTNILVTASNGNDYAVTETPVFGWDLSFNNPVCTVTSANGGSQSATTNGVNINLREGENVTCTFINTEDETKTRGNIKVVKQTLPDGSSQSFTFTANYDLDGFALTDGASDTSVQLTPSAEGGGPYSVSENAVAGWTSDGGVCDNGTPNNITVVAGETTTCTFTNTQTPKLTVIKHVINDNGGTAEADDFTMNVTATNPSSSSFPGAEAPGTTITLDAGAYSVGESGPSGYTASSSADCSGTIAAGDHKTCTITNNDQSAHLKLVKVVVNDNGGTAKTTDFTLSANGPTSISGAGGAESDVNAGNYALSETSVSGYTASAWSCEGGTQDGANITLAAGQSATCTITNDDQTAHLKLVKIVTNDNGGTAKTTDFTLSANGPTSISGAGGAESDVNAGSYALSETSVPGYTASAWSCDGGTQNGANITLGVGQSATCTITNNDQAAHLKLVKTVTNNNGGTAVPANWTLSANGPTPISGAGGAESDVNAGVYTLSESAGPAGYTAGNFYCTNGVTVNAGQITLGLNQSTVCTINNNDVAPVLHLRKVVVNNNGGTATTANFTLTANGTGANDLTGTSPVDSGSGLQADTWALSETTVFGYTASAWSCVGGYQNGSNITLTVGLAATCSITNDDQPGTIIIEKLIKPSNSSTSFSFQTTGTGYNPFSLAGGQTNTQQLNAGSYTAKELVPLGWVLTGIGGSTDPNTPFACTVTGSNGSTGVGDLNTQTVSISLKSGDTVRCVFENTGQGVTRTQGFWATHPQLAQIAWFGGTAFGHTFPGVIGVSGIANRTLCTPVTKDIDTLGKLTGGFWSDVSKTTTGAKRSATDQARMQLLQQLLAAELNASAFGSVPSSGTFAQWEAAYCSGNANQLKTAQQQAASFNTNGDSGQFTPGTSADSKNARAIANTAFWNVLP
jgi:hypothetical protein